MNSKRAIAWMCAILTGLAAAPASADKAFRDQFKAKYIKPDSTDPKDVALREAFQDAGCNVCHVGDNRENRNAYGKALAQFLSRKTDKKNRAKIQAALDKVAAMKSKPSEMPDLLENKPRPNAIQRQNSTQRAKTL